MTAHIDPKSQHAVYAPSASHRWIPCTASPEAIASLGPQERTAESKEGDEAHSELERVLNTALDEGLSLDLINWDHPAARGVALALDYVRQLFKHQSDVFYVEERVILTPQIWGKLDVGHWSNKTQTITVVDFKNGQRAIDVEENPQLRIYAAALMFTHKLPAKHIRYALVQLNDWRPYVPRVKQWLEPVESLYAWASHIATIPTTAKRFVAGDHCRNCPLFGKCEASHDLLKQIAVALMSDPKEVRPDQIAMILHQKKPIEDWFKGLEKAATTQALKGKPPAGMNLFTATKHRTWINEENAFKALVAQKGFDAALKMLKMPTPAQAQDAGMNIEGYAQKPEGGPVIGFANDKRQPWKQKSAEEMFGAVNLKRG